MAKKQIKKRSKKKKKHQVVQRGKVYITATFNNTLVTITDENGNTVCWSSTGTAGFTGSKKSTPYAATITIEQAINKAKSFGMRSVELYIKGPGPGRDAALRVMRSQRLNVTLIADITPLPHNGTRPKKRKRG